MLCLMFLFLKQIPAHAAKIKVCISAQRKDKVFFFSDLHCEIILMQLLQLPQMLTILSLVNMQEHKSYTAQL